MAEGQGFASMSKERRKQVAKAGSLRAEQLGLKHKWTAEEARAAAAKGAAKRRENFVRKAAKKLLDAGVKKEKVWEMGDQEILETARSKRKIQAILDTQNG